MTDLPSENTCRRLLIIDDNHAIHADFRKILAADQTNVSLDSAEAELFGEVSAGSKGAHFEIDSAFQGQEGLERTQAALAAGRPYAMAFIDVRMPPGWDGIETTARIWEADPDLQVVICTAYSDYSWEEMLAKLGQSDRLVILKKPFDNIEVMQLAHALTEKRQLLQSVRCQKNGLEAIIQQRTEELRANEERFRLITENAGDLIAIIDTQGRRLYSSPSYEKLLGYTSADLQNAPAFGQIHPEDVPMVAAKMRQTIERGSSQVLEYRMHRRDGTCRIVESHAAPFRNRSGAVEGALIVARDITLRKEAEQERQMLEVQLRQAQKLESIGQLAAGIAHEINTPTQFIGDNTRFVRDAFADIQQLLATHDRLLEAAGKGGITPELLNATQAARRAADLEYLTVEIPKAIDQTLDGVERVTQIVRAMKEFSHPGTEAKVMLDLNKAIESTATVCRSEWKYVADLAAEFDPSLPTVPVLPGEFNQVILNVLINATHAIADVVGESTGVKGLLTVSTRHDGEWAEIRITDTGTGIPEKARDRVFDPFFTTKAVGKGTGQGLAIARSVVVDKHGGTIRFETVMGKGTTFIIRLPLKPSAVKETSQAA